MKSLLAVTLLVVCSIAGAAEDTTSQENTAFVSPSSTMSNVQVNTGTMARSTFGGGVGCSDATLSVSATKTPSFGEYYTATISTPITAMFKTTDCEKAARTQNQLNQWRQIDLEQAVYQSQERHDKSMQIKDLEIASGQAALAKVCLAMHKAVSANPNIDISKLCSNFAPLLADHHSKKMNMKLMPKDHERISPTRYSWGK